ncbi:hypothetical protein Tco_0169209 [Tanacetum coccineum]
MVPRAVLMKSGLVSINTARQNISKTAVLVNTARQVNAAHSKTTVNAARPMSYLSKIATLTLLKAPLFIRTHQLKTVNINQGFITVRDETSGILKSLITGIENLVDHRVKVIRCDNGTEFKNRKMNQFYEIKGSGPDWLFDIDALTRTMNYEPIIAGTQSNGFAYTKASDNADPKSSHDDGSKPSSDDGKKVDEDLRKENECNDQEKGDNVNNVNNVNAAGTNKVNAVDNEDDGSVADMNNLDTTIEVSPILTTRIHKDHHLDQVIRDLQSATQTRKMSKNLEEHEFVSTIK